MRRRFESMCLDANRSFSFLLDPGRTAKRTEIYYDLLQSILSFGLATCSS